MNIFGRLLLHWRLRGVDVRAFTKKKKFPLGHQIIRNGVRYRYCKREAT